MQRSQSKNMRRSQGAAAEAEEHSDFTQMKTVSWKTGAGVNFFLVILWELELEQGQQQQAQKLSWMKVASNDKSVYFTKKNKQNLGENKQRLHFYNTQSSIE